jgi:hypothetical protein
MNKINEAADAKPTDSYNLEKINVTITDVALPGPPSVIIQIWSNAFKEFISNIVVTNINIGRRDGTVILRKVCNEFAPSIAAASCNSLGTF